MCYNPLKGFGQDYERLVVDLPLFAKENSSLLIESGKNDQIRNSSLMLILKDFKLYILQYSFPLF